MQKMIDSKGSEKKKQLNTKEAKYVWTGNKFSLPTGNLFTMLFPHTIEIYKAQWLGSVNCICSFNIYNMSIVGRLSMCYTTESSWI